MAQTRMLAGSLWVFSVGFAVLAPSLVRLLTWAMERQHRDATVHTVAQRDESTRPPPSRRAGDVKLG